jgi:hypothetical protein
MKKQIKKVKKWIKKQPINGCITGSSLLDYFEGQDVDVFAYSEASFNTLFYTMYNNKNFQLLDKKEKRKAERYIYEGHNFKNFGLLTIKFKYNTCVDVNIIYKKGCTNAFAVISSFDMDIIAKCYDIKTKKYLNLSENLPNKKATWNKWNEAFYSTTIWQTNRLLRQLVRCFKYHKRGYNTDEIVLKYVSMLDNIINHELESYSKEYQKTILKSIENTKIVKEICLKWLETHEISEKQIETINNVITEI